MSALRGSDKPHTSLQQRLGQEKQSQSIYLTDCPADEVENRFAHCACEGGGGIPRGFGSTERSLEGTWGRKRQVFSRAAVARASSQHNLEVVFVKVVSAIG